jgi:nickel-dependent lactate racemase
MNIKIPYLNRFYTLEIPQNIPVGDCFVAEPGGFTGAESFEPAAIPGLEEFLKNTGKVLVIVNDATRPTPTGLMLKIIMEAAAKAGLGKEAFTLLVATGAHRVPTEEEYRQILGDLYGPLRPRCTAHDSRNDREMADLGETRNGTPIILNRLLFEFPKIIITGSVEPHYFAGFTGGRKAFLPGIASYATIEANHKLALSPKARSLALEGNPVHEDMMDALSLIKAQVFSIMAVLDKDQGLADLKAGDVMDSFYAAVESAKKIFCVQAPWQADIVVSVAKFPMDIDLYQSQKGIDNGAAALKDGGFLILVSPCRKGIGDEAYAKLLASASSPADALERIKGGYKLGYHKAAKMAGLSGRASIFAVTELPKEQLKPMFIEGFRDPQMALDEALGRLRLKGIEHPRILVLPDGCVTVPELNSCAPGAL